MKIAITGAKLAPLGDACYKKLKAAGFDAVDFTMMSPSSEIYQCSDAELPALIEAQKAPINQSGIEVFQTHGPWPHPTKDSNEEERAVTLAYMCRAIRATALLGSKYMVVHPLFPFGTREPEGVGEQTFEINVAFFRRLLPVAHQYDVTVCLENMPFHHYSHSHPADILRVIQALNDTHFQMCLDTGHVNVFPELSIYDEILRVKEVLRVFHIHDNGKDTDRHQLPFFGKLDWTDFARAWKEIDFKGAFSFETAPPASLPTPLFEDMLRMMPQLAKEIIRKA